MTGYYFDEKKVKSVSEKGYSFEKAQKLMDYCLEKIKLLKEKQDFKFLIDFVNTKNSSFINDNLSFSYMRANKMVRIRAIPIRMTWWARWKFTLCLPFQ